MKSPTPQVRRHFGRKAAPRIGAVLAAAALVGTASWAQEPNALGSGRPLLNAVERDHEFDHGSGVSTVRLSNAQITNLATLGKVWGFLKYYHPSVTAGEHHWDYDLFRILPRVLAASTPNAGNEVLVRWIDELGDVPPCNPCVELETGTLQFGPDEWWIRDRSSLGKRLSERLTAIYTRRQVGRQQFYVALSDGSGKPVFLHEVSYEDAAFPDTGVQLIALFRFWNMVEYWYPYRNVIGEDWDRVLRTFVPHFALATTRDEYVLQLMSLVATVHDTHANLWSSLAVRPPVGACRLPIDIRFVGGQPAVIGPLPGSTFSPGFFEIGDVITALDGVPVTALVDRWKHYYGASNGAAQLRDIASSITRGECGDVTVGVARQRGQLDVKAQRVSVGKIDESALRRDDLPGETFQRLSPEVSYIKLSSVKADDVSKYIDEAAASKGLIVDIRGYPSAFVVFALGSLLVDQPTPFARFTSGDLGTPGAFHWGNSIVLTPKEPHFRGKTVILIDEFSQSQAEYTAMALRAAPNSVVVGSTTAGADGNISQIPLPGSTGTVFSGIGVFYPDKRPTQHIGIVPDVRIDRTLSGIRGGTDEVLEEAVRQIAGMGSH